jgi:sarcosine oxidase
VRFDAAVIGLGAMGSAAALGLSRRGARVAAFDAFTPPHALGSSHGRTRIIREAYYEHPLYVPLVRRAYELWSELEREADARLLRLTGGVVVGAERGTLVAGALMSARAHGIDHEMLGAQELADRFPAYRARADWVALYEKRAGLLFPEACVSAMLDRAGRNGAAIHFNEEVTQWRPNGRGLVVQTLRGSYDVDRLIVAAGPWLPRLRPSLGVDVPVEVERQLSHWFAPTDDDSRFGARRCPVGLWDGPNGEVFATLPDVGQGVKCGMHHAGTATNPDSVDRQVSDAENEAARSLLQEVMPGAAGSLLDSRVCLYTNTPDRHFIIDWLQRDRVLLLSPCSGHGFKFATAIGEIAAQLTLDGKAWLDLKPFALSRFRQA